MDGANLILNKKSKQGHLGPTKGNPLDEWFIIIQELFSLIT